MKLSIFSWSDENTEGFDEVTIGELNDANELDLRDSDAQHIIDIMSERLRSNEHVTFRIENDEL